MPDKPPFRADHVGSLLRPPAVKEARRCFFEDRSIPEEELREIEDKAIRDAIRRQQDIGLPVVTDGEFRREWWHFDFMGVLTGLHIETRESAGIQFHGTTTKASVPVITERLDFPDDHPMLDHFRFVAANTGVMPKISIPGPSCVHYRTAPEDIHVREYREDPEALFADLVTTYRKAVHAFYEAGCCYLQMDDIFYTYLCDPKIRADWKEKGVDPDWLIDKYADTMGAAIADRPEDMVIGMHMCRGNFQSTWVAEGGYDPAADAIFNRTGIDIFFMEYDTDRAGGLEPLRLLPKGSKRVMPGFITTKTATLESMDALRRHFDEAAKFADLDQMGIAPQCGFASTEEGNKITMDDQWRKLELVVKTAEKIWGSTV